MGLNRTEQSSDAKELEKLAWYHWNPGVDNDDMRLGDVLETLPAVPPTSIPWQIRLLENPSSRFALPGAITLEDHDVVHVILGRGLKLQDEAFVIGYTMGNDSRAKEWHRRFFKVAARYFYPKPYNFKALDLMIFDLGWRLGETVKYRRNITDIHLANLATRLDETVGEVRKSMGLLNSALHSAFNYEQSLIIDSSASQRLDTGREYDPSSLFVPEGEDAPKREKSE